jgi:hypothetical protein
MVGYPRLHLDFTALQLLRACTSSRDAPSVPVSAIGTLVYEILDGILNLDRRLLS